MKKNFKLLIPGLLAFGLLSFNSCKKDDSLMNGGSLSGQKTYSANVTFYALAGGIGLDKYSTQSPQTLLNTATITGLQAGEIISAMDFRPATGQLYGFSNASRLYVINPETGSARMIGPGPIVPALTGTLVGFDFNPTVDRIRVVTSNGENIRLNPETGTVAGTDLAINGQPGAMISSVAYINNFAGSTTTTLYGIDNTSKMLFSITPPNNGTLVPVGSLGLNITGEGGFDISSDNNIALGLYEANNKSELFQIDLMTGDATKITNYDKSLMYTGIAIPTRPVAYAVNAGNNLLIFRPDFPSDVITKSIMGVPAGVALVGLDFRPLNGQLYALGNNSSIYTINAASGAATLAFTLSSPLSGTAFGFDFNPLADRIRIISNTGQNLRFNPNDGVLIIDGSLNPGTPMVTAAAYANNFTGTTSTELYVIDFSTGKTYEQMPPNNGTLVEVGNVNVVADEANGFDIGGKSNIGYALLTTSGSTKFYTINLNTGAASLIDNFTSGVNGFTMGLGF